MARNVKYLKLFEKLGEEWHLDEEVSVVLECLFWSLFGYDDISDVNLSLYKLFCTKKGDCLRFKLPPCRSSLRQRCLCANFQSQIWKDRFRGTWLGRNKCSNIHNLDRSQHQMRYINFLFIKKNA